jgi:hypothetical protein
MALAYGDRVVCSPCWQGLYPKRIVPPHINEEAAHCEMCDADTEPNQSTWVHDSPQNYPFSPKHDPEELNRILARNAELDVLAARKRGGPEFLSEENQVVATAALERAEAE